MPKVCGCSAYQNIIIYSIASRIPPGLGPGAYKVAPPRPSEGVPEVSWRGPGEVLEAPGGVWEASWSEKKWCRTPLGHLKRDFETSFNDLVAQKIPQKEAKRVPNRARNATCAQNGETPKLVGRLTNFLEL